MGFRVRVGSGLVVDRVCRVDRDTGYVAIKSCGERKGREIVEDVGDHI